MQSPPGEAALAGSGRLLIRESGTEPLIRVMAEADDEALVSRIVDELCETIAAATLVPRGCRLMRGRVLVIAGSDSGGGAGIQADIKTITAFGGYAATAITALTAQNTLGVEAVHMVPPDFIARQIVVVMGDIGADVVKIGMLGDAATIEVVCDTLAQHAAGHSNRARSGDGGDQRRAPAGR